MCENYSSHKDGTRVTVFELVHRDRNRQDPVKLAHIQLGLHDEYRKRTKHWLRCGTRASEEKAQDCVKEGLCERGPA